MRQYSIVAFGFGWEELRDEYKLVVLFGRKNENGVEYRTLVYNTETCRTLDHDMHLNCYWDLEDNQEIRVGQFVNGKLHWLNRWVVDEEEGSEEEEEEEMRLLSHPEIVFCDMKSEKFGVIEIPFSVKEYKEFQHALGTLGGYLCFICHDSFYTIVVWAMKEHGWEKQVTLSHARSLTAPTFLLTFVRSENGEILLLSSSSGFRLINPRNNASRPWFLTGGHVYVESLVAPN